MISLGLSFSESFLVAGIDCRVLVNSSPSGSINLILACHAPSPFLVLVFLYGNLRCGQSLPMGYDLVSSANPKMKLAIGRLIDRSSCDGIDMVIKDLDLEPKIKAMIRDFLYPSQWKELSKETSSKILPCGDGSCWKKFKQIASLIMKGKLK
nr:hypothetical protein [Tanacetum cinerariifolium]